MKNVRSKGIPLEQIDKSALTPNLAMLDSGLEKKISEVFLWVCIFKNVVVKITMVDVYVLGDATLYVVLTVGI